MKTKAQKADEIKLSKKLISGAKNIVFVDFGGVSFTMLGRLKKELKKSDAAFKVLKKRLLKIALKESGMDFDPTQFDAQAGSIFVPGELSDGAAAAVYKFGKDLAKEKKPFKILGAYDAAAQRFLSAEEFTVIAKLPSREALLGQVASVFAGPIRAFMYALQERSKKVASM
ncbi:MAG: 50S ribosomal protein L10 [Patescibacteria group bacterium]